VLVEDARPGRLLRRRKVRHAGPLVALVALVDGKRTGRAMGATSVAVQGLVAEVPPPVRSGPTSTAPIRRLAVTVRHRRAGVQTVLTTSVNWRRQRT
jgi:hypothetical protein